GRENCRKSQGCSASVKNTAEGNAERGSNPCFTALCDTAPQNVNRVRTGRQVEQNPRGQEYAEVMNPEHLEDFGSAPSMKMCFGIRDEIVSRVGQRKRLDEFVIAYKFIDLPRSPLTSPSQFPMNGRTGHQTSAFESFGCESPANARVRRAEVLESMSAAISWLVWCS